MKKLWNKWSMFSALMFVIACTAFIPSVSFGQPQALKIATGECTSTGCSTYVEMFRQLKGVCGDTINMTEVTSKGSVESIDRLVDNQINGAFVQTDVLFWRKRNEDMTQIKTLIPLHPEEIHFVTRVDTGLKEGGFGIGSLKIHQSDVKFDLVDQLAGYKVGAVNGSGSMVSGWLIKAEGDINYEVVGYNNTDEMKAALKNGAIQAMILVGGAPLPAVQGMNKEYKLLSFGKEKAGILIEKKIYAPASLTYSNLTDAQGIRSLATQASFVVYDYKKNPAVVKALADFRACANDAIGQLQETTGTHKKWKQVKVGDQGRWPWYELPVTVAPVQATKKK